MPAAPQGACPGRPTRWLPACALQDTAEEEGLKPIHELPNPYAAWAGKPNLWQVLDANNGQLPGTEVAGGTTPGNGVVRLRMAVSPPAAATPADEGGGTSGVSGAAGPDAWPAPALPCARGLEPG